MEDQDAVGRFERELRDAWGCADKTVSAYLGELASFKKWCQEKGCNLLTIKNRGKFLDWRAEISKVRKPNGVALAVTAVRSFYNVMADYKVIDDNPFPSSLKVKIKKQEPTDVPSVEQFLEVRKNLERPVPVDAFPVDTRRAIVETLAGSGLRIDALLTLKPRHLRLGTRPHIAVEHATMACKGGIAGEIPISPYCAQLLTQYLEDHPRSFDDPIFAVSGSLVRKILHQVQPEGLKLKPHSLRHFYCSMCYFRNFDGGQNDIVWVRDAAGHGNISTTNNYLKMARRVCQDEQAWELWAEGKVVPEREAISA